MTTYAIMQARIADDFINESITTAQIKNAIQTAISNYENTPLYFNQKIATFSTVAAQEYYGSTDLADIPNIVKIRSAEVTISGNRRPLTPVDYNQIDDNQNGAVTGAPYWYAPFAQQLRFYPLPDAAYPVKLSYIYKFAALVADADTNAWMTDGEELVRQCAKRRLALDILHSNDMAARCRSLEDEAFDGLRQETRQRLPNTTLKMPAMMQQSAYDIYRG